MQRYAQWFRDNEGRGYPGAIVTVYLAGTPNKATIYSAQSVTPVEIANPLVTDTNGFYNFAAANGVYDIQIEASGMPTTVIYNWTASDLTPVAGPFPATNVSFSPAGTVASSNVQLAIEELDDDIVALDAAAVHIAGTETVTGAKTFSSPVTVTDATDSTSSTSSASIKTSGGISCAKAIYAGSLFSGGSPVLVGAPFEARLTLSTTVGQQITTTDQLAKTSVYLANYGGNLVAVYVGSTWVPRVLPVFISVSVPNTTNLPFDIFVYDNAGTLALEAVSWSNASTRASQITVLDGIRYKTTDVTRRYCGTGCTTGVSGQCEDSVLNRYLWNYYNRVERPMRAVETTDSWAYTTSTIRQANGNTANQFSFVIGVDEEPVYAEAVCAVGNTTAAVMASTLIGLDATNAMASGALATPSHGYVAGAYSTSSCRWRGYPGVGKHYLAWLEYSSAAGTTTWYGDNTVPTRFQSGIMGVIRG